MPEKGRTGERGEIPFPDSYMELLKFVDKKAILPSSKEVISEETKENVEYAVFVFLLDRISPSAKFEVKVSADETRVYGL